MCGGNLSDIMEITKNRLNLPNSISESVFLYACPYCLCAFSFRLFHEVMYKSRMYIHITHIYIYIYIYSLNNGTFKGPL